LPPPLFVYSRLFVYLPPPPPFGKMWRGAGPLAAVALLLAALAAAAEMPHEGEWLTDPDRFPGWRGSLPAAARGARVDATAAAAAAGGPDELWNGRVEQVRFFWWCLLLSANQPLT
jgi:hypothetical protein